MYYVMRTHSHTDRQQWWKVMSRPIQHKSDAEVWKSHCEQNEKNEKHEFFIIEKD